MVLLATGVAMAVALVTVVVVTHLVHLREVMEVTAPCTPRMAAHPPCMVPRPHDGGVMDMALPPPHMVVGAVGLRMDTGPLLLVGGRIMDDIKLIHQRPK